MATNDTTFINNSIPAVSAGWLNDVGAAVWGAIGTGRNGIPPVTHADVLTNLGAVSLATLADTTNIANGDALVGFRQSNVSGNLAGAVARTVHQKLQELVSILDFGADPTGVADSSSAFSSAINIGGTITVPPGTYKITTPAVLTASNLVLLGIGRPTLLASVNGKHIIGGTALTNVTIDGIIFQGNGSATTPTDSIGGYPATSTGLVTLANSSDIRITNCEARSFYNGFAVSNSDRVWILFNRIRNWLVYGVLASEATNFHIDFNNIVGCDQAGAANAYGVSASGNSAGGNAETSCSISFNEIRDIPSWDGIMSHEVQGIRIIGNDIRNVRSGIDLSIAINNAPMTDVAVSFNYIEATTTDTWAGAAAFHNAILLSGFSATSRSLNAVINGNTCKGFYAITGAPTFAGNTCVINVVSADRVSINNNVISETGTVSTAAGIYVLGTVNQLSINANIIQGAHDGAAIRLGGLTCDVCYVGGNVISQTVTTDIAVYVPSSTITSFGVWSNPTNSTSPFVQSASTLTFSAPGTSNTGTFIATLTGCTTSPTATVTWAIAGNVVTLTLPSLSATSNTTACTLTGLPASLQPATNSFSCPISAQNNGAYSNNVTAGITAASGTITLAFNGSSTGWTNVGTKGPFGSTIVYSLT